MVCAACGAESPDNARFCVGCGNSLPRCAACGALISPDYRFCPDCGRALLPVSARSSVSAAPTSPHAPIPPAAVPPRPSPHLTTDIPPPTPEQERRQVAILFADIVGFTALSERLDPEEVHSMAQASLTSLAEVVVEHGGHVDKFIGDCVMALFGAPVAHEDDVLRAVAAATAMQARMESLNATIGARHGARLAVRIGINAGLVIAGELGRAGDYTVMGDAVNVASRIQGLAQPGAVVVTAPVRAHAVPQFQFTPCGSVTVRNRSAPVEIFELAVGSPAPPLPPALPATPFVGREGELARLREALALAREGRGAAVWIVAEAGMGKSRLLAEFVASAVAETPVLSGYCRGYAAPLYLPFRHWFEQLPCLADRLQLGDEASWRRFLPCPEDFDWLRWALFPGQPPPAATDPETAKRVAHSALLQWMRALSQRAPLLLVLEDLHWADVLTLELVAGLAREAPRLPVLLVATTRPEGTRTRPGQELPLGPLGAEALEALLDGLLAPHAVSPDATHWLIRATHGNPFFLEELAQSLRATGELLLRDGCWILSRSLTELRLPDTVRGVVQARIDALDPIARTVVREAAILGTPFDTRVLQAITSAPGGLEEVFDRLAELRILAPVEERTPFHRSFHQAVIQQVAYESMLSRRRRDLHERAARELESLYAGRETEVLEDLAEHYARAEARDPAVRYLAGAAARAQSLYANDRARALYSRLLELTTAAPDDERPRHDDAAVSAECGLADLDALEGELDAAIERLRRVTERDGDLAPEIRAGVRRRLAMALAKRGEAEASEAELAAALALIDRLTSVEGHRETARVWYQRASMQYRRGRYEEAERALGESDRHATAAEDAALRADCLLLRGLVHYDTGRRREAQTDLEAALERKEAIGDLRGMAAALNNLGNLEMDEGRFADARARYLRALELRRRIGLREGIAAAEINLGNVALSLGDWPEAQARLEAAQALCEEIGDAYGALAAAANRGRLALETGHAREARRRFQAAAERAHNMEFANLAIDARIGLAEAEVALGDGEKALNTAAAAREEAEAAGDPMLVAAAARAAAMAAAATGRFLAAEADFSASRRSFRELALPLEEARTLVRWAATLDDPERLCALLEEAEVLARRLGAAGELARIQELRQKRLNRPSAPGSRRR